MTIETALSTVPGTAALPVDVGLIAAHPLVGPATPGFLWKTRALLRSLRGGPGHDGPPSDHFDGRYFFNPEGPPGRFFLDLARCAGLTPRRPWPRWIENRARPALPLRLRHGQLALSCLSLPGA